MGILEIGRDATGRTSAVWPRNRLILLRLQYIIVHTPMCAQTKCEYAPAGADRVEGAYAADDVVMPRNPSVRREAGEVMAQTDTEIPRCARDDNFE